MFLLDDRVLPYSDPWATPLATRLAALETGDRRVAYYYEAPDTSTFRYRVYNMIEAIRHSGRGIAAAFFAQDELERLDEALDRIDVLVICRARYWHRMNEIITRARGKGVRILFDVDDLVFDPSYVHLLLATLDQDFRNPKIWDSWFAYVGRIGAVLKLCDGVIVTNDYLASRVRAFVEKPVFVIQNFLNEQQIAVSTRIYEAKKANGFVRTDEIHLGYFSGTPSHNRDFGVITGTLAELLESDPRIRIRIAGFLDLKKSLSAHEARVEIFPLQDFVNLQRLIGAVEVNLIPLQDNTFTNCKSELKYFEAAITGTVSVATPTFTLAGAITDGENGYLARSVEWYEKIRLVIDDLDRYPALAEKAYQHSLERYHWNKQADVIENVLFPRT